MNVVGINNKVKKENEVSSKANKDVVNELKFLLDIAKEGHIQCMVATIMSPKSEMENIYVGEISKDYLGFMGMLTDMQLELKKEKDNG